MSKAPRHAPKLRGGQSYIVRYGNKPRGHITGPLRHMTHTVCGLVVGSSPPWGTPSDDLGPGLEDLVELGLADRHETRRASYWTLAGR